MEKPMDMKWKLDDIRTCKTITMCSKSCLSSALDDVLRSTCSQIF